MTMPGASSLPVIKKMKNLSQKCCKNADFFLSFSQNFSIEVEK